MEAIRSRPPSIVMAAVGDVPGEVSKLAKELATSSPSIPVAAIFRPNGFRDDVSESGVLIEAMRREYEIFSGVRFRRRNCGL